MNKYISRVLNEYQYPIINSILFISGKMLVLKSYYIANQHKLEVLCESTIASYFKYNDLDSVSNFTITNTTENTNYKVYSGEGSWGGDGIVYIVDKKTDEPICFLFLENSNPFIKTEFIQSDVHLLV